MPTVHTVHTWLGPRFSVYVTYPSVASYLSTPGLLEFQHLNRSGAMLIMSGALSVISHSTPLSTTTMILL
jgi:hypothetical protein